MVIVPKSSRYRLFAEENVNHERGNRWKIGRRFSQHNTTWNRNKDEEKLLKGNFGATIRNETTTGEYYIAKWTLDEYI